MTYNAPLMTNPTAVDQTFAATLLEGRVRFLARGATCTVFTNGARVVRLSDPDPAKASRFRVDAQVRRKLHALGVPTPLTEDMGVLPDGRAYSIEALIRGDDLPPTPEGVRQLSRAIKALHTLECCGFGLLEDRADSLCGSGRTPAEGVLSRLHQPWPFAEGPLAAQPLVWAAPDLQQALAALEDELLSLAELPTCVCHTDLHLNQWLWRRGELAALLDFGDASVGPVAWDWASLAYFHGWPQATELAGAPLGREVALFGLLLAFHRASRAARDNHPQRTDEAAAFARSCLERLEDSPC
ncbi:aminoglycoside phosphotransferase family protein [Deinococcus cavernae]|uniref:Aminoglycoside phosphotransferase family protein n=2 Tax=Deinococcus cavernae TaxID=2320857 RepID=A0A418V4R0_9DEIO|nr:aminoglycoside phosphotransferase family protein [Deinococcus cavernae]